MAKGHFVCIHLPMNIPWGNLECNLWTAICMLVGAEFLVFHSLKHTVFEVFHSAYKSIRELHVYHFDMVSAM